MEDSAAGIVVEGLQPGSLRLGAPGPDNVTVVEERENVIFKGKKRERLRKKPREMAKETDVVGHLGTDRDMWSDHMSVSLMVTHWELKEQTNST